jgi:hypothetical protein
MKVILLFSAEINVLFSTKNCSMSSTNLIQKVQATEAGMLCETISRGVGLEREFDLLSFYS